MEKNPKFTDINLALTLLYWFWKLNSSTISTQHKQLYAPLEPQDLKTQPLNPRKYYENGVPAFASWVCIIGPKYLKYLNILILHIIYIELVLKYHCASLTRSRPVPEWNLRQRIWWIPFPRTKYDRWGFEPQTPGPGLRSQDPSAANCSSKYS